MLVTVGAATFAGDRPLTVVGRASQWLLNKTVRRRRPVTGIPQRLLHDRDAIRQAVGAQRNTVVWAAAGNTVFDYFALLAALRAVGAEPHPSLVLLAYTAAELLTLLPLTPGGLGFVEAGLVGTLTVAGVPGVDALAATLLYRIVAYWLPLPAGATAYALFRHRYNNAHPATWDAGLDVTLHCEPGGELPPIVELTAYRIVQEALTNVLRHANAGMVTVEVRRVDATLRIDVVDDGHGTAGPPTEGLGLTGMRERTHALGGTFRAGPDTDNGFHVEAALPL